jgi:7-cyano-7-deazaguanine synthase
VSGRLVILSGGLDSTICLALAAAESHPSDVLTALTFDYGQRHRPELDSAAAVARHYGADHLVVQLDASAWGGSALTDDSIEIPIAGHTADDAIPVTYVPARNLIFLSVAVGVAEARDLGSVAIGVNALDYSGYPDCRPEFIRSFAETARLGLKRGVEGAPVDVLTPLIDLSKAAIVRLGREHQAPFELTWSCYRGGPQPCTSCDACILRAKGFAEVGIADPARSAR